jgi:hypothetical protein
VAKIPNHNCEIFITDMTHAPNSIKRWVQHVAQRVKATSSCTQELDPTQILVHVHLVQHIIACTFNFPSEKSKCLFG